jgi:hypothetical protein
VAKYFGAGKATDDNTLRRMPTATNTHSEYVILIPFPLQQWLYERASILRKNCKLVALPNSIDFSQSFHVLSHTERDLNM